MMVGETSIEPHLCVTVLVYNGTKKVMDFVLFFEFIIDLSLSPSFFLFVSISLFLCSSSQ